MYRSGPAPRRSARRLWVLLLVVLLGCAAAPRPPSPNHTLARSHRLQQLVAERSRDTERRDYVIGPGDRVDVSVFGAQELSDTQSVAADGRITLPLIGAISAAGKTEAALATEIERVLAAAYLESPEVVVSVSEFQGRRVSVLGAVVNPGFYVVQGGA